MNEQRECRTALADPSDPFDYHLYVGFVVADIELVSSIIKQLAEYCNGLKYYPLFDNVSGDTTLPMVRVKDGISFSEKCLLCVTPAYIDESDDELSKLETKEILKKAKIFEDAIIILLIGVDRSRVPESLQPFATFQLHTDDGTVLYTEFVKELFDMRPTLINSIPKTPEYISGYCEANTYFSGFLTDALHCFRERIASTLKSVSSSQCQYVSKLLIVVPDSCRPPLSIEIQDLICHVEFIHSSVIRFGEKHRDLKVSLIKLADDDKEYFFACDIPCCLRTLYMTQSDGLTGMTEEQLSDQRKLFFETLRHEIGFRKLHDECMLIEWHDDLENMNSVYQCLLSVCRKEAESLQVCNYEEANNTSVSIVELYERDILPEYPLQRIPRGICAIVDCRIFADQAGLLEMAESNVNKLEMLFRDRLNFEIHIKQVGMVTKVDLHKLMLRLSKTSHDNFDAFVCCLISRGRYGHIRTSDDSDEAVLELAQYFDDENCPSLRRKPKLFFTLNCLSEDDSNTSESYPVVLPSTVYRNEIVQSDAAGASANDIQLLKSDSLQSSASVDEGELLIPTSPDFVISYCSLIDRLVSIYADTLLENIKVNSQVERALKDFERHIQLKVFELNVTLPKSGAISFHCSSTPGKAIVFLHD